MSTAPPPLPTAASVAVPAPVACRAAFELSFDDYREGNGLGPTPDGRKRLARVFVGGVPAAFAERLE